MLNPNRLLFCLLILSVFSIQTDLVLNGNFTYNLCPETYCSWNISTYDSVDIYGWIPDPEIHIGSGHLFNPILGDTKVLYLPGTRNSCIRQVFDSLKVGSYTLNIHYIAQKITDQAHSQFSVRFNEALLKTISPSTNELSNESIEVELESFSRNVELQLCAEANSENSGTVLTKVELWGESKSSLRKEDSVLSEYHLLPLKEKSSRLLATVPLMDFNPTFSTSNQDSSSKNLFSAVLPLTQLNWSPTKSTITPTYSTVTVNSPVTATPTYSAPSYSQLTYQINPFQSSTSSQPASNNLIPSMTSTFNNVVSSTNSSLNSMNVSMPTFSVTPTVVNVSAMANMVGGGSTILPTRKSTTENYLGKDSASSPQNPTTALNNLLTVNSSTSSVSRVILNGSWTENKQSFSPTPILNNWSSNSNCSNSTESSPKVNSTWTEKKPSTVLGTNSISNTTWESNSNCSKTSDSTSSQWTQKKTETNLSSKTTNSEWQSNSNCTGKQSSVPLSTQKQPQEIQVSKSLSKSDWDSYLNCTKTEVPSSPYWTEKKAPTRLSESTKSGWKSNSKCSKKSANGSPTETNPQNSLQSFSVLGFGEDPSMLTASSQSFPTEVYDQSMFNMEGTFMNSDAEQRLVTDSAQTAPVVKESSPLATSPTEPISTPLSQKTQIITSNTTLLAPVSIVVPTTPLAPTSVSTPQLTSTTTPVPTLASTPVQPPVLSPAQTLLPTVQNNTLQKIITQPISEPQKIQNLIINGEFQTYKCQFQPCLINSFIPSSYLESWIPEPFIEIGLVQQYNPSLETTKDNIAVHLGFSSKNTCIKQSLKNLKNQFYDLTFEYAPVLLHTGDSISEAFFIVKFNGRNVKNVLVLEKSLQRQKIVVKGIRGENIIEFCAFGSGNESPHGAIIDSVALTAKSDPQNLKTDFIVNGDFQNNVCFSKSCIWNKSNFDQKNLVGWLPEPEIEIGQGSVYNVHAGISTVAELSPNSNSCIKQVIDNCVTGSFNLQFSWAARDSEMLHDSVFQVKMNGKVIKSFIPNDYMMHRENVVLNLKEGRNQLMFCSFGMNNNMGAIIDDVSMFLIDSCKSV